MITNEDYLDSIIEDFVGLPFHAARDVSLENLRDFLIPILQSYEKGSFDYFTLMDIAEGLENYFHKKYAQDYPDTTYPVLPDSDSRSLGMTVIDYMHGLLEKFFMFPEDVPYFLDFLQTPAGKENEARCKLESYVSKINYGERLKEAQARGYMG